MEDHSTHLAPRQGVISLAELQKEREEDARIRDAQRAKAIERSHIACAVLRQRHEVRVAAHSVHGV
jgi:hypothetical protein